MKTTLATNLDFLAALVRCSMILTKLNYSYAETANLTAVVFDQAIFDQL